MFERLYRLASSALCRFWGAEEWIWFVEAGSVPHMKKGCALAEYLKSKGKTFTVKCLKEISTNHNNRLSSFCLKKKTSNLSPSPNAQNRMKYVLPLLHSFRTEDGANCGSVSNDLEIISRGMNKSINQWSSGYLRGNLISLFIRVFYLFSALQGRSRNPKLSRGLGGAVPLSPEPHSGGNVFNGLGRVKERSGPAAY